LVTVNRFLVTVCTLKGWDTKVGFPKAIKARFVVVLATKVVVIVLEVVDTILEIEVSRSVAVTVGVMVTVVGVPTDREKSRW
jgi:hypothetical protein